MSSLSIALVVGSAYGRNGQLARLPSVALDCELMERRLSDRDAGFRVFRFEAERGLAERIEQRLLAQPEPIGRLVFYFSGYCAVSRSAERSPGLLLDGARLGTFSLARLRKLLEHYAESAGVILDAALVTDRAEPPRVTLQELGAILTGGAGKLGALIAARKSDHPDSFGGSEFTGLLLMVVDWLVHAREAGQPVNLAWLYEGLKVDPTFYQAIPAIGLFPERARFVLVPPARPRAPSVRPPVPMRAPVPGRAPSFAAPEALPRFALSDGDDDGLDELTPPFASSRPPPRPPSLPPRAPVPEIALEPPFREARGGAAEVGPRARVKLPSFEPSSEVADALVEAGEFARAVEEYAAVLEFVTNPEERAVLLAKQADALRAIGSASGSGVLSLPIGRATQPRQKQEDSWEGARLLREYEQALARAREPQEFASLVQKLDELYQAGTSEPRRVARALEQLVSHEPSNLALCDRLIDLYARAEDTEQALLHCRRAARLAPKRAATYRRALRLFEAVGIRDGAWNAASVLDTLGEADINESLLASQHRPEGLLAARGSLANTEWESALLAGVCDDPVFDLLEALGPVGVRVAVGFAKVQRRYMEPDPSLLQDTERSTTTLAKTLVWTARLLGLTPPALYVLPDFGNRLEVAPTEAASVFACRNLASGLGLGELSFLWGRALPRFRNELRALSFFRSAEELSMLLMAALALGECPNVSVQELDAEAKRLYAALRRELRGPAFDRVRLVARDFPSGEVAGRAAAMLRGLELLGVRAGLVACGDASVAAEFVRRYPTDGVTGSEEQLAELFSFAISAGYTDVRRRIGVAVAA